MIDKSKLVPLNPEDYNKGTTPESRKHLAELGKKMAQEMGIDDDSPLFPGKLTQGTDGFVTEKIKEIIANEWCKRFLLGASLILFAGTVFYMVAPKWHYFLDRSGLSYRYNSITGEAWEINYYDDLVQMMKVRLKTVKSL